MSQKLSYDELLAKVAELEQQLVNFDPHKQQHIISSTQDLIAFVDQEYVCQSVNDPFLRVHNKRHEDIIGYSVVELLGAKQFNYIKDNFDRSIAGEAVRHQTWFEWPQTEKMLMDVTYYPYIDSDGGVSGVTVNLRDITDLKTIKRQCELVQDHLDTVLSTMPDGVYIVNERYDIEYINPVMEREFGLIGGKKCYEYLRSRTVPCSDCRITHVLAGKPLKRRWKSEKNHKQYELYDSPLKKADGTFVKVVFFHDVTRLRQMHNELIQQRFIFDGIVNNSSAVISVKDLDGKYAMVNNEFEELYKLDAEEIIGKTCFDIFDEKTALQIQANDQKVFTCKQLLETEEIVPHVDGMHTFISIKFPLVDSEDIPFALGSISTDITERKRMESELQNSNENLINLINASPDIICFKDHEGRWLLANNAILQLFELDGVDYKGKKDSELAEISSFFRDAFLTCQQSDKVAWNQGRLSRADEEISLPDGTRRIFDVIKVPLFYPNGERKGLVIIGRGITERVKAENELQTEITFSKVLYKKLQYKNKEVEDTNTTLKVLLGKQQQRQEEIEENMATNLKEVIMPYLDQLELQNGLDEAGKRYLKHIKTQVDGITTPFARRLRSSLLQLSQREIQIAELIIQGKRNKEISELLGLSLRTIETYRNNLRKKLNLSKKKINLRSYLLSNFT